MATIFSNKISMSDIFDVLYTLKNNKSNDNPKVEQIRRRVSITRSSPFSARLIVFTDNPDSLAM